MRFSKLIAALLIISVLLAANAASLGSTGPTYPIGEENVLDMIMKKLHEKKRSGELKRLQEEAIRRSTGSIKDMKPVDGITTVRACAQRFIDPAVTYTKPMTTDDGHIVVPTGTKISPLDMASLTKTLVFFDGHDPEQREIVGCLVAKGGQLKAKPILVAGSWLDLTKAWKTQVFHDQKDILSKRFDITAVSAVIRRQGKMPVFDEIPAKKLQ